MHTYNQVKQRNADDTRQRKNGEAENDSSQKVKKYFFHLSYTRTHNVTGNNNKN